MDFNKLLSIIQEDHREQSILFVEDDAMRIKLIEACMKKYNPHASYLTIDNNKDAIRLIERHYNHFTDYSLDYNLKLETSEPVAEFLKSKGNDGTNVWIHSDDPNGQEILKRILPKAKIKQVPSNIVSMIPDENL